MSKIKAWNRRHFLGAASASVLAPQLLARGTRAPGPEPVRVAVIGTGGRGCDLIRKLDSIEDVAIVAVCDDYPPHLERGQKYAGQQAKAYADWRKLLEMERPQAIVIALPLYLHYRCALDAIDAGIDVFCEKTMCRTVEEAQALVTKVESSKVVFQVGHQRRASPIYLRGLEIVDSGALGRISSIKAQWHRNNDWRRPVPVKKGDARWQELEHRLNWRLYWDYSEGLMTELGSHQLDVANWVLGCAPKRVMASGGIDWWRDGREVFDNVYCILEYELPGDAKGSPVDDGEPYKVRVTYSSLQSNAFEGASELIFGAKGTLMLTEQQALLYYEKGADKVEWKQKSGDDAAIITSGKTLGLKNNPWASRGKPAVIGTDRNSTRDQLISFADHVRRRDPKTMCDVRTGYEVTAAVVCANQAAREGKTIEIPAI